MANENQNLNTGSNEEPFNRPGNPNRAKSKDNVNTYVKHIKSPSAARSYPCPELGCNYTARQKGNLIVHLKIHSGEKSFLCLNPGCSYSTNYKNSLLLHNQNHTGIKPFVCPFESCCYAGGRLQDLVHHSRTHTKEKPYKCPEPNCEYAAAQNPHLKRHLLAHSPKEGEERPSFKCALCEYTAKQKSNLSNHIKSHTLEKLFKCDEPNCSHEAKKKADLTKHKVVHSDEKPFACSVETCEFRCKTKGTLKNHELTHSKEKQYKCELCPFQAKTRSVVLKHIPDVHFNFRPFKCTESKCDFAFKRKGALQAHILIHSGEKKYACPVPDCEYKAVTKSMVKSHQINVHETDKKFKCGLCEHSTKRKQHLTRHMKTHTNKTALINPKKRLIKK